MSLNNHAMRSVIAGRRATLAALLKGGLALARAPSNACERETMHNADKSEED